MSENTWSHRAVRPLAGRLARMGVPPNVVTLLRLGSGGGAAGAFAVGTREAMIIGGVAFVLSCFLDRLDGETARAARANSDFGDKLDRLSDVAVTALLFIGVGVGLRDSLLDGWAVAGGLVAALAIVAIYAVRHLILSRHGEACASTASLRGLVDHDDALYMVGPVAWLGAELPFLLLASVGAPAYAVYVWLRYRSLERGRGR